MKIRCIVVDDEPIALQKMQKYAEQTPYLEMVAACDNPIEAMRVLSQTNIDAIFTDINMLELNGLDFVSSLSKCPLVVFITAYDKYAVESYRIGAVDYIVKPYGFKEFQRAADRVRMHYQMMRQSQVSGQDNSIFVRSDGKWVHIRTENIRYVQGLSDYLRISLTENAAPIITYGTFAQMKDSLPANFLQVHRSWIVNLDHIKEVERKRIIMDKDTYIPIGESFVEQLMSYLEGRSVGKTGKSPLKAD